MAGVAGAASVNVSMGEQVQQLATGMSIMAEAGITDKDADTVAYVISEIGNALSSIHIDEDSLKSVGAIAATLNALGKIDKEVIDNIKNLKSLNVSSANNIVKFISALDFTKIDVLKDEKMGVALKNLSIFMNSIVSILERNTSGLFGLMNPVRAWLLGKAIGVFFSNMVAAIPKKKIEIELKGIADIIKALDPLIEPKSKYSIKKLKKVVNEDNGRHIGQFFSAMIKEIPNRKNTADAIKNIADLMDVILKHKPKVLKNASKVYNQKNGVSIGEFFSAIVKSVSTSKELNALPNISTLLNELSKISKHKVSAMKALFKVLNGKNGKNLNEFITNLTNGLTDAKMKKAVEFGNAVSVLCDSMLKVTASILLMAGGIALFGFATILGSVSVVVASMFFIIKMMKKITAEKKSIENGTKNLNTLMVAVSIMTVNIIALAYVAKLADKIQWESLAKVGVMMVALVGVMAVAIHMGKNWKKNGKDMLLGMIGVTTLLIGGAMAVKIAVQVAAENKLEDVLLGVGIIAGTMLMTVGLVKLLGKANKNIKSALVSMAVMTALLAATALVINELIIPIGEEAGPAALGVLVVGGTLLALTFMVKILGSVKNKNLVQATLCVAIMSFIMLGIGLITKEILIPLGLEAEAAFIGAGTAMAITIAFGLLTSLFGVVFSGKRMKYLKNGVIGLAAMAGVILALSEATRRFVVLAEEMQGLSAEDVLFTGLTVVALVTTFGTIAYAIGRLAKSKSMMKNMAFGAAALAAIGGVVAIVSSCMMPYIELAKELSSVTAEELWEAGLTTVCVIGAFGLIMAGVGALVAIPQVAIALAAGAAAMAGVSIVIALVSTAMIEYAQKAVELAALPKDQITAGSELTLILLGEFGLLMAAAGALAIPILIGGVVLKKVLNLMSTTTAAIKGYAELALATIAMNGGNKNWDGGDLQQGTSLMISMLENFKSFMDLFDKSIIKKSIYVSLYRRVLSGVITLTKSLAEVAVYTKQNLTPEDVTLFNSVIIGTGLDDKTSMIGALNSIVDGMLTMGDKIGWGIVLNKAIRTSKKILDVISNFIDVIAKVSTLTYVMGYDSNGNPMFGKIKPEDFGVAADVTTTQFKLFIERMIGGFEKIDIMALILCSTMDKTMKPVIKILSKFVDIVMKVASSTYIIGYDDNEKPIMMKLTADEFGRAAEVITSSFSAFIESMITNFKDVSLKSAIMIEIMGESMMPIMEALGSFADTIIRTASGTYISGYDENGKPQYIKITDEQLKNAAVTITNNFITFIQSLQTECKKLDYYTANMIDRLGEGLGSLMSSIGGFADGILKIAGGTYITGYDENGKPILEKISDDQINNAASVIIDKFCSFVDKLAGTTEDLKRRQVRMLGKLGEAIGPVMTSVSSFADSVLKFAGGSYITGYDENGKPQYARIESSMIEKAAGQIMGYYNQFMGILLNFASQKTFQENGEKYMATIGKIMEPIMESVVDFSEMITNFLKPHGTIKKNGKEVPFFLDLTKIKDASVNIATAYVTFLSTLVEQMQKDEKFKENIMNASSYIKQVTTVIKETASSSSEFKKLVDNVYEIKGLSDIAKGKAGNPAELFINSLVYLATKITEAKVNFALANETMILANAFLKSCTQGTVHLKNIMTNLDEIKGLSSYETKMAQFSGSISALNALSTLEFGEGMTMVAYLQQSVIAANQLKMIYNIMEDKNMADAVHKFVNNIQTLSSTDTSAKMSEASRNMGLFTQDLNIFSTSLNATRSTTIEFTVSVNNAVTSIRSLDNAIFSREKKRNQSLKEFNELIQNIANSVESLSDKIEKLDKNQILENFKGIRDLLTLATGETPKEPQKRTEKNGTNGIFRREKTDGQPVVVQQPQKLFDNTIIEFRFDNVQFTGIANTKD